jgi:hypothetical protein
MLKKAFSIAFIFIFSCKSSPDTRQDIYFDRGHKEINESYLEPSRKIVHYIRSNDFNNFLDCFDENLINTLSKGYIKAKKIKNKEQFKKYFINKMENKEAIQFVSTLIPFIQNDELYKTRLSLTYRLSGPDIKDQPVFIFVQVNNLEGFEMDPSQEPYALYGIALNEEKHIIDIVNFHDERDESFLENYNFD